MARQMKLLAFRLKECLCALYLEQVLQVVAAVEATPLPQAPEAVIGAIDLHGEVIPLLSIRKRFGFVDRGIETQDQYIIAKAGGRVVALAVDEVRQIVERSTREIVAAERIIGKLPHIDGVIQLEDGLALIHDLDKFLSLDERRDLDAAIAAGVGHES